jgi:hypothetical protein
MGLRKFVVLVGGGSYNPLTRYDDEMMMLISANSVDYDDGDDSDDDDDVDDDDDKHSRSLICGCCDYYRMHLRTYFLAKQYLGKNINIVIYNITFTLCLL